MTASFGLASARATLAAACSVTSLDATEAQLLRLGENALFQMNLVEVFFLHHHTQSDSSGKFHQREGLIAKIQAFIASYNKDCKPFTWTKPADVLISKARRKQWTGFIKNGTSIT